MGLIIQEQCVIVDHNCPDWLITQSEGNPTIDYTDGLKVYAIFKDNSFQVKEDVIENNVNWGIIVL